MCRKIKFLKIVVWLILFVVFVFASERKFGLLLHKIIWTNNENKFNSLALFVCLANRGVCECMFVGGGSVQILLALRP